MDAEKMGNVFATESIERLLARVEAAVAGSSAFDAFAALRREVRRLIQVNEKLTRAFVKPPTTKPERSR